MKTSKLILYVSAAAAVGAIIYKSLQPKDMEHSESDGTRHKNRHLTPVFSKVKQITDADDE